MDHQSIENAVRLWLQTVVIDLNLCPFAERALIKNGVRFIVTEATTEEQLLLVLHEEFNNMSGDATIETTLLIHPDVLQEFDAYNQFLLSSDRLLVMMDLEGVYQVASFHPDYQFENTAPGDVENYTNRSPFPMLHILREASLNAAIDKHPDVHQIPEQNIRRMREMGPVRMQALLRACLVS